jgi:putative spermidine/putrescine transport system ATP-binding protein
MALGDSLAVVNVSKHYKKVKAVDDVSLTVHKGEFMTILGPSGSGKTSLLKLIAGFEEVSSGTILLNDQEITSKKAYERQFGMLFQNYALFPHMTVFENIAYPLRLRKVPKQEITQRVRDILELVHLQELASRYPKQLSGGQQQRVALARAIVFNPPLLLLDEPLGALDKNLRQQMQLEIKHIQEKVGITTISVTHDQEEALTMSDRICVMNKGSVEQIDTPENLYKKPRNRFIAEFIGDINLIPAELQGAWSSKASVTIANQDRVTVEWEEGLPAGRILIALRPENIRIVEGKSQTANTFRVKVVEMIYLGEVIKTKTVTDSGQEIIIKIPARDASSVYCGKDVLLGWDSNDATVIPDRELSALHA